MQKKNPKRRNEKRKKPFEMYRHALQDNFYELYYERLLNGGTAASGAAIKQMCLHNSPKIVVHGHGVLW